jgi:hypothetical protein
MIIQLPNQLSSEGFGQAQLQSNLGTEFEELLRDLNLRLEKHTL